MRDRSILGSRWINAIVETLCRASVTRQFPNTLVVRRTRDKETSEVSESARPEERSFFEFFVENWIFVLLSILRNQEDKIFTLFLLSNRYLWITDDQSIVQSIDPLYWRVLYFHKYFPQFAPSQFFLHLFIMDTAIFQVKFWKQLEEYYKLITFLKTF